MDVSPVLIADIQVPEAVEPGERPFDQPPVASQAVLGLDTTAGDAGDDAALAQGQTEVTVVVTLFGVELVRSATGPAARLGADGLDGVDGGEHHLQIVHVRGAKRKLQLLANSWCAPGLSCATGLIMQSSSNEVSQLSLPEQDIGLKCLTFDWATNLSQLQWSVRKSVHRSSGASMPE
jgi:hypothetical protein